MKRFIIFFVVVVLLVLLPVSTALADDAFRPSYATPSETAFATGLTVVVSAVFIIVCLLLGIRRSEDTGSTGSVFWLTALLAVLLRVIIALTYEGFATDIGCFKSWAVFVYENGPAAFYTLDLFADYPPGYMYVLWLLGFVRALFNIDTLSVVFTLIIKLPSIIAEVVLALIVFREAGKQLGKTFALLCAAFLLFNPALFFNSSVWGQVDAFFTLFAVLVFHFLRRDNPWLGALFYALALLIKPQALVLAPVVALAYIYAFFRKGSSRRRAALELFGGAAVFLAVFAALVWPFTGSQQPTWILSRYVGTVSMYPYATVNAFNLFALTGGNWAVFDTPLWLLTYKTWGYIFICLSCVTVAVLQWRTREEKRFFDIAAFLVISVFMLGHAMHERYMLPACVFLLFAYVYTRDVATLFFSAAFSVMVLLNQMAVLYAPTTMAPELPTLVLSALNVLLYAVYSFITIKKLASRRVLIKSPALNG